MAMKLLPIYLHVTLIFLLLNVADCSQTEPNHCNSSCAGFSSSDLSFEKGVRYTYRYRTTITTALSGSSAGRNGLALDCVVDIDVVSRCHLMMQIRNPQIKRLSAQKEHSVQRLKSLRDSLERTCLKFSLQGGKVRALCLQEGEQVWALNIKRALLSMLQTSHTASKQELDEETDFYGTCTSRYERTGPVLLKSRDLKQCHQSRLENFWPHSVPVAEDTMLQPELHCVQRFGSKVIEEVNCTETLSMATLSSTPGLVKTQTVSTLVLLRAQQGTSPDTGSVGPGVPTDLQFEDEGAPRPGKTRALTPLQASQTVRMLCSLTSDPQQVSKMFLQLAFQLRDLTVPQLKTLWQEASFKCRNDWQPLLDALPACGSENCIILLTDLMMKKELEEEQARAFLTTIALIPHPSPQIINSINVLLQVPELQSKTLLCGSALIYQLCQKSHTSCSDLPEVQTFTKVLEAMIKEGCESEKPPRDKLFYALKSVGNLGLSAPVFIPLINCIIRSRLVSLELKLAAIQAFRRFPCSADRNVLLQLYGSSLEDPEVRIAAYQQLLLCPNEEMFEVVKMTLRDESSSQVGSYVWSHLTNVLKSEDPMKQALIESLPDDIISRDFESEFMKYSSFSDYTVSSDMGITNVETSLVFSPKSFLPRSATANLTVYFHGRAHNLLEVDFHVENAEPLLKKMFVPHTPDSGGESVAQSHKQSKEAKRTRRKPEDIHEGEKEKCLSSTASYLDQAKAMLFGQRKMEENRLKCWVGVKVFGNELSVFTCDDLHNQMNQLSLIAAGLVVKLLKGQEVQLNHRAVLITDELILPSLSGLPFRLGVNMTSLLALNLKGNINYRDTSHFSLTGYIKPNAHVGLSVRMGVVGALGQAAVDWLADLRSSTSLDGSVQLQEGRDLRVTLNTPEDVMDIISISSKVFKLSGDLREEIKGPKSRVQRTTCTPKTWSKMIGWQLCSNASYPLLGSGVSLPPPGPVHFSLRLLKLDRGLHYYLLEAAYSLLPQKSSWFPKEASLHLLLATPQSSVPRDMSLDLAFNPHRLLLRLTHPLKTILVQGQLEQERKLKTGRLELLIDGIHYYVMGLVDTQTLLTEQRTRYHLEAKMASDGHPIILSANVTRGLGSKTSFSVSVKNVFRETASLSVALERRRDSSSRQYSVEAELLLPGVVGTRMLGLVEQKGSLWSSALRLKYGLGGDARHLRQDCYTSQRLRGERDSNVTYVMRADHEFYCSNTAPINHKVHFRHEESPSHIKSVLDVSYGKHWDEINNKRTLILSQSFKNQSSPNHTSYTLEFSLQVPEMNLNYRTQLLHSHLRQSGSESSTHLKVNYNNLMPLVAGLHWKSPPKDSLQKKWEGTFNMDTPWLYIYTSHKLSQQQLHTLQLTSELTASKWLTIRNLQLEGFYKDRGREKEARLQLRTPAVTYIQAEGWGVLGKRSTRVSCSFRSLWSPPLRGDVSLEASKLSHTLQIVSTYGKNNVSLTAALNTVDKKLKKRQAHLKMTFSKPKSPSTDLEFEGVVEELRKDKKMYQKTAMLHLRQPFQIFPQTVLLQETFTVDLVKGLYVLQSKAGFYGNREIIHKLSLGYRLPKPYVCSALVHPFSSDIIPSDSEICVTIFNNQTHKDLQGRLRVGSKEKLTFFGDIKLNPLHSNHYMIQVRANYSHQLQLQIPSSAIVEGNVFLDPKSNTGFNYQAGGKLRIERQECKLSVQLNGTLGRVDLHSALSHPFKSKIPKTLEVKAAADISSAAGRGHSSVKVRANGKDRVNLEAMMSHTLQRKDRAVELRVNVSQSVLNFSTDLHVSMAANMSSDSVSVLGSYSQGNEGLLAHIKGSLKNTQGLQVAVLGDLRHTITNLHFLPPVLGLDGVLGQSNALIEGQLRLRVTEALYSVVLKHQQDTEDSEEKDEMRGNKLRVSHDWLCVWFGEEHLCLNVSRQLGGQRMGEVHMRLSHSFHLLNETGVPANSSAKGRWVKSEGQLSVLAELQAGSEHLRAEFNGGRTDQVVSRWEYSTMLQHRVKALLKRGIWSSMKTTAHYQLETGGVDTGLILHVEDEKTADAYFHIGDKNGTVVLTVSLWHQIILLQGLLPNSLQMNCTGDATADRLSAQCSGNVAGGPVEVRVFRSYRPHSRLCYGLSVFHSSLSADAKGCYTPNAQKELKVSLNHSSTLLLLKLGLPTKSSLRLLLRPGPQRWALGISSVIGSWEMDFNVGVRLEKAGLYGCHGLLKFGTGSVSHKAEMTGRLRFDSWCHIWADVNASLDSVTSSLMVSVRCKGFGKLVLVQVGKVEGGRFHKTAVRILGQAVKDGFKGSLGLENGNDSVQCLWSTLLKDGKAEVDWTLQHHWTSLVTIIPNRMDLQGSAQLRDDSLSGGTEVSFNTNSAQVNMTAAWELSNSLRVKIQQNMSTAALPGELTVSMSATAGRAGLEVESDTCSLFLLVNQPKVGDAKRSSWNLFAHQRCVLLKTLLPSPASANISITRSGCSTDLRSVLHAGGEQKGNLTLTLTCHPHLSLKTSVQHSIETIQLLGFPTHGGLTLNISPTRLPGLDFGLDLGGCFFRGKCEGTRTSLAEKEQATYTLNVTNYCPALQGSALPVSLSLQGLLSVSPCQHSLTSSLKADDQELTLQLSQSCRPPHLSGTLTHSLFTLKSLGVPQIISIDASTPLDPEQAGSLFIKSGTCFIRADRVTHAKGRMQWLWALESTCPVFQAHLNGSVWQDPQGTWTVTIDTDVEGRRGFLRLNARAWPELGVEGELRHNHPAPRNVPQFSKLRVTCRVAQHGHDGEAFIQMDECAVGVSGGVMSQAGLRGSLLYNNNCTVIQEWGSPGRVQSSGLLVVTPTGAESQVSMAIDNKELQASLALKKTRDLNEVSLNLNHSVPLVKRMGLPFSATLTMKSESHGNGSYSYLFNSVAGHQRVTQEMTVIKTFETIKVRSRFKHTANLLKKLGIPANNSIQLQFSSAEGKALTLQSEFGGQQAGIRLKMKCFPMAKEIKATMWHSWSWLQDRGLPLNIEGLCAIQGLSSHLQSQAHLSLDGQKLLLSGLNISASDGRLALLLSFRTPSTNQTETQHSLDSALTVQFKGPLRSASLDVRRHDWRVVLVGDVGGLGTYGGSKEGRVTLRHTVRGEHSPTLQVEAWGRLTESQLRCSVAVNPAHSSSLALIVQGHRLPQSKDLMVKMVQTVPVILVYLPSQLNVRSQLNQSESGVASLMEVLSGRRRLWAQGELAAIESGYRQSIELKHSFPQLKPIPRAIALKTVYESRNWSYQVQHGAVWGNQEFSLSGLYSAPPSPEQGNQTLKVQINCVPRWTSLELNMERSVQGRLDSVLLGWARHGRPEQVRALSWWSCSEEMNETKLELNQPFSSTLGQMSLHSLTLMSHKEQHSSHTTHLSWNSTVPINISINLNKQRQNNSSRKQACAQFTAQQMEVSLVKGCVTLGQEGNSFSQNAELRWDNSSIEEGIKYQRGVRGMHSLQVNIGLDKVSPAPCPSHTLYTKIQTNLRDRLEHMVLLGLCPPQPTLLWSGSHRVNSAEELFYSQSRLSVTGQPHQCSLTFALTNSSTVHGSNMSLISESRIGNWSMDVGGSAVSWLGGAGLQVQARLDSMETIWLNGSVEGRCLRTTAGYKNGPGLSEDVTVSACVGTNHSLMLDVQKRDSSRKPDALGHLSVERGNQSLMLRASGCLKCLTAAEERIRYLSSRIRSKLLGRLKMLQHVLIELRQKSRESELLQELSAVPLHVSQRAEALLGNKEKGFLALWQSSTLRLIVTNSLPHSLSLLQHASLLGQQELRRPLATLAGVYQDVTGQRPEALCREAVHLWTDGLMEVSPALLENPRLRPLTQACVTSLRAALDMAGQQTYHWMENRLAMAVSGVRKRLASVYKFSPSEGSVVVSVPLPPHPWPSMTHAGLVDVLVEDWLLRPLKTLASVRPVAELYRLKRKIMDSPLIYQALLVADQFVVTFDGHLYELVNSCHLLLAQDVSTVSLFTVMLNTDSNTFLLIRMDNDTITIQRDGQVKANCNNIVTHTFHTDSGVSVRRGLNIVQVTKENGASVSCDLQLQVCSFTLDRWFHGTSAGLLGTNDYEAGNDFPLSDGSQAENMDNFFHSWQMKPDCTKPSGANEHIPDAATSQVSCDFLFSSPDSPLSSCFRVVGPSQFLSMCEMSSPEAPCRLASAFVHLCQQNYIPLEVPVQCMKV